jgi:hypothetical protein
MPFRNYSQFDSAALDVMTAAYDAVVARLQLKNDDPLTANWRQRLPTSPLKGSATWASSLNRRCWG